MKERNPKSRFDLNISKSDYVLEVGGGHNPHRRSNVIVDKYDNNNYHRSGDIFVNNNQKFLKADGADLPFDDNEFDYVICNQVLEHVDNPSTFLKELSRVARRGYIETPSLIGEYLFPKESHSWVILELDGKLVLSNKSKSGFVSKTNFGDLFLHFLPRNSFSYKMLERTYPDLMTVRYEWIDNIDFIVEPTDHKLRKYFDVTWNQELIDNYFKPKNKFKEFVSTVNAFNEVVLSYLKNRATKVKRKFSFN